MPEHCMPVHAKHPNHVNLMLRSSLFHQQMMKVSTLLGQSNLKLLKQTFCGRVCACTDKLQQLKTSQTGARLELLISVCVCMHYMLRCLVLTSDASLPLQCLSLAIGVCPVYLIVCTVVAIHYTSPCASTANAASAVAASSHPGLWCASLT